MSLTVDERGQMVLGHFLLKSRDFEMVTTWGTAPLPVIATAVLPGALTPADEIDDPAFTFRRRMFNLFLFGLPLVAALFCVLRRSGGLMAASVGTAMLAFSPMFIAHAVIAATDVGATLFIFLGALAAIRFAERATLASAALLGLATGVAMAAKQTAVIFLPLAAVIIFLQTLQLTEFRKLGWTDLGRGVAKLGLIAAVATLVTWGFYGFHLTTLSGPGPWRPHFSWAGTGVIDRAVVHIGRNWLLPASWVSFVVQMVHNHAGHGTFFLGTATTKGTWLYWPIAVLLKSTPAELLAIGLVALRLGLLETWRVARYTVPAAAMLLLVVGCMSSNLNIGLRYLLPAFPLALLLLFSAEPVTSTRLQRSLPIIGLPLAAGQLWVALEVSPNHLSYFNGLFAARRDAHWLLADANLDWGHGLPAVKDALARQGAKSPIIAVWGYLKPENYGVKGKKWDGCSARDVAEADWLVISVSVLRDQDSELGRALRGFEPDSFAGLDILFFSMSRPEIRREVDQARARQAAGTPVTNKIN